MVECGDEFLMNRCEGHSLENSVVLSDLGQKLKHLNENQRCEVKKIIMEFKSLFCDVPRRTDVIVHDVEIEDVKPVKQHPYRVNPFKREIMRKKVQYMLMNDLIEPSISPWSSPCLLVRKPGEDSYRFCTDFRKVNAVVRSDFYPIPRIDDCIDQLGKTKFMTKLDLLKGFWQVRLTEKAKEITAFVTKVTKFFLVG